MTTRAPKSPTVGTLRDRLVKLAQIATTPLVPSDYLDLVAPLRSGTALRGRITAIHPETRDAVTLVIRPGRDWQPHEPGQYARLGIDVDGVRQWRTYSLTSKTDRVDGCIAITVKAIPGGTVSNHLVRRARVGTIVHLDGAAGDFTLGAHVPAKVLFVTAGSGITPVMGMLRNNAEHLDDVVVVHSAPTAADMVFGSELRKLAQQGRIRLIERHTETSGRLGVTELEELVHDLADRETWACGPAGLLDTLEQHWAQRGLTDQLHTERFRIEPIVAGDGGTVTFTRSGTTAEAAGSESLLDAGEGSGVLMPSGCRMGVCFGCVVPLKEGAVRDLRSGDITEASEGVLIQTCVSAAAGSCNIDV
ncbi:ferredoxin reductase [Hoyosella subflava]|uniref:Oxidoreductase FAD-binding domain protein n=1 Tax=Hoyosella subflava (strain DSM 45089 / JCM 17490 / NBRC 109087 / DQS3-9A1) TaxID=443218 RepID=F6EEP2_HOYSD|nr:ferredoxin reductase [Hoyosella subflava]AEF40842.1 Oxidoreductase FAD-binding domain protein [Hoyosella subflava DQS3-9A1]